MKLSEINFFVFKSCLNQSVNFLFSSSEFASFHFLLSAHYFLLRRVAGTCEYFCAVLRWLCECKQWRVLFFSLSHFLRQNVSFYYYLFFFFKGKNGEGEPSYSLFFSLPLLFIPSLLSCKPFVYLIFGSLSIFHLSLSSLPIQISIYTILFTFLPRAPLSFILVMGRFQYFSLFRYNYQFFINLD